MNKSPQTFSGTSGSGTAVQNTISRSISSVLPRADRDVDIKDYIRDITDINYISDSTTVQEDISEYMVTRLEHVKQKKKAEHEDIIATVKNNKTGDTVRLLFGRFKGHDDEKAGNAASSKNSIFQMFQSKETGFVSSSTSSSSSPAIESNAKDVIRNFHGWKPSTRPATLRIFELEDPKSLPLLHLISIVDTVHDLAPKYSVFKRQCYWFAMMVMAISMLQGGKIQAIRKKDPDLAWQDVPCFKCSENPSGLPIDELDKLPLQPPPEEDLKILRVKTNAGTNSGIRITQPVTANRLWWAGQEAQKKLKELTKKRERALKLVLLLEKEHEAQTGLAANTNVMVLDSTILV